MAFDWFDGMTSAAGDLFCSSPPQPAPVAAASDQVALGGSDEPAFAAPTLGFCRVPDPDSAYIYGEGELRSAETEYRDFQEVEDMFDVANPTSDSEMQDLIDQTGQNENAYNMGPHAKLKFLADNGMAPNLIPPRHRELMETDIPDAAKDSLMKLDQDVHNPYELGEGNYNIDEYSVILDKLPDGMTEEEFLNSFLKSPNDAAKSSVFDLLNVFQAKKAGSNEDWSPIELPGILDQGTELPEGVPMFEGGPRMDLDAPSVGDWYHLEIPGNDGDVMIVDKDLDMEDDQISATVQTMTDDGPLFAENHPVSGRRQFGLEKLPDGGYRFYTRGFDRATNSVMEGEHSRMSQDQDWSALMRGIAAQHGGRAEHVDADGNPVWGWHEHYSAEDLLKSGVMKPPPACE